MIMHGVYLEHFGASRLQNVKDQDSDFMFLNLWTAFLS